MSDYSDEAYEQEVLESHLLNAESVWIYLALFEVWFKNICCCYFFIWMTEENWSSYWHKTQFGRCALSGHNPQSNHVLHLSLDSYGCGSDWTLGLENSGDVTVVHIVHSTIKNRNSVTGLVIIESNTNYTNLNEGWHFRLNLQKVTTKMHLGMAGGAGVGGGRGGVWGCGGVGGGGGGVGWGGGGVGGSIKNCHPIPTPSPYWRIWFHYGLWKW